MTAATRPPAWAGRRSASRANAVAQAAALAAGRAIAWYCPEVPDLTVDQDGTITEHEDARPAQREPRA
jgi:hypothetical protein